MKDICPKRIIACDPSYAHFGLTLVDLTTKEIRTFDIQTTLGSQGFHNIAVKAKEQVEKVHKIINDVNPDILPSLDTVVGMENSLPFSFNATSLTALDVMLYHDLNPIRTATFNPTYLTFLMGKHKKSDSINLATALIKIFTEHGYNHVSQAEKKLTDGEAESFIYAARMLCRTQPENEVAKSIIEFQPLFSEEKEKYIDDFIY